MSLKQAWVKARDCAENENNARREDRLAETRTREEILRDKLNEFAFFKAKQYVDTHTKEQTESTLKEMGRRSRTTESIYTYPDFQYRDNRQSYKYSNLESEFQSFDQFFVLNSFGWQDIYRNFYTQCISLEKLTKDLDYEGIYVNMYKTKIYVPGNNASLMFLDFLGLGGSWHEAVVVELCIKRRSPSECNIM